MPDKDYSIVLQGNRKEYPYDTTIIILRISRIK
jgi:hypothetical protein